MFLDISGDLVQVLTGSESHKYLGRKIIGDLRNRSSVEISFRKQCAWMQFHKHRMMLTDHNVSMKSRLKFSHAVITPTILFGLTTCSLTITELRTLDVL